MRAHGQKHNHMYGCTAGLFHPLPPAPLASPQSLPFRPSHASLQAVIASIQAVTTRRRGWRAERTRMLGALSVQRTQRAPLFGRDLRAAVAVEQPVAQVRPLPLLSFFLFLLFSFLFPFVFTPSHGGTRRPVGGCAPCPWFPLFRLPGSGSYRMLLRFVSP